MPFTGSARLPMFQIMRVLSLIAPSTGSDPVPENGTFSVVVNFCPFAGLKIFAVTPASAAAATPASVAGEQASTRGLSPASALAGAAVVLLEQPLSSAATATTPLHSSAPAKQR